MNKSDVKEICATVLNYYQVTDADSATANDIEKLFVYRSDIYAHSNVYAFKYKDVAYYINDDYSLDDNPEYLQEVLESVVSILHGSPVKNPHVPSSGKQYTGKLYGKEYYLWQR